MDIIDIEIINWDKFNPKRDQTTYTWLRLNNDIATDPELFGLSAEQKFVWIEILCQASKKNRGTLTINVDQLSHVTGVKIEKIHQLLDFLTQKPIILIHDRHGDRARPPVVATTTPTNERTNETNERTNMSNAEAFDEFYSKYPKKEKKKEARKRFDVLVKSGTSPELVMKGLSNYLAKLAREKTDPKFYKLPTTWLNELPDNWINDGGGVLTAVKNTNYSEMATELWHWVDQGGPLGLSTDHLWKLCESIGGFDYLKQLHRDDFRPAGIVPGLLKQAAEEAAS